MNKQQAMNEMKQSRRELRFLLIALICACLSSRSIALEPTEIVVIAAERSPDSQALAKYYCEQRGVPLDHICRVNVPTGEVLDRKIWKTSVRPAIRHWLVENDPDSRIKCLLTLWDVPLKVAAADPSESVAYRDALMAERDQRLLDIKQIAAELAAIATGEEPKIPTKLRALDTLNALQNQLEGKLQEAQQALVDADAQDESLPAKRQQLQQLALRAGGVRVLLQGLQKQINRQKEQASVNLVSQFSGLSGQASGFEQSRQFLSFQPAGPERDLAQLLLIERTSGLLGAIKWLNQEIETLKKNETGASFDSELSLVLWPDEYELSRWQPNTLGANFDNSPLVNLRRTLMVSRIDGPSLRICKRLIDDAIAVEKAGGLAGKFYIDARGIADSEQQTTKPSSPGSYEDYDQALYRLADQMRKTAFDVVVEETPELFGPGKCPEAALYCGWYSLGNYIDAFDFVRGAVAVHMASAEAKTLREESAKNWCKCLLEDGVCATVGPVYEPYLIAFPRPDSFFDELANGEHTLVECYYRTKPFSSWMMVLVGDPLYRPRLASREQAN